MAQHRYSWLLGTYMTTIHYLIHWYIWRIMRPVSALSCFVVVKYRTNLPIYLARFVDQREFVQHVHQETAACAKHSCQTSFNLRKYDRITPALVTLHWLPLEYRIEFKTLLIVFKGLHGKAPTYIQEMITPSKSKRYSIRSNEERVLKVPKFKHDTFGKRAFAVYGSLAWNCLPKEIRLCDEIEAFKRNLKTHLFVKFVNESTLAIWFWRIIVKRPRMLSAQFVALYKPCKPKPKPCKPSQKITRHRCILRVNRRW